MTVGFCAAGASAAGSNPLMVGVATGSVVSAIGKMIASGPSISAACVGVSASSSAILAAFTTKTATGSIIGAASGAGSATVASWIASIAGGPLGGVILGTQQSTCNETSKYCYFYDCWKPVLREMSQEPSLGIPLRDVLVDARVKQIKFPVDDSSKQVPSIIVENIWEEKFSIQLMVLPETENITAHAIKMH